MADNQVAISIVVDTSALVTGLAQASKAAADTFAAIGASIQQMGAALQNASNGFTALAPAVRAAGDQATAANQAALDEQVRQRNAAEALEIKGTRDHLLAEIALQADAVKSRRRLGQISAQDEIAALTDLENQKFAIKLKALEDQTNFNDLSVADTQRVANEEIRIADQTQLKLQQLTEKGAAEQKRAQDQTAKQWQQAFEPVSRAADTAISGMILGTETWQKAVVRIGQSVVSDLINNVFHRIVNEWIIGELTKTAATETGNAARAASDISAGDTSAAAGAGAAKESVVQHAWSSAAAVYDDVSQIPYVGWILAPPAAAAAATAVLAFGSNIPGLAVGAWDLPNDMIAQLHAGETVLPADFASGFRSAVAGGNGGGAAIGDTYSITIQAIDTQTGAQFLKNNMGVIVSGLQTSKRNGATIR